MKLTTKLRICHLDTQIFSDVGERIHKYSRKCYIKSLFKNRRWKSHSKVDRIFAILCFLGIRIILVTEKGLTIFFKKRTYNSITKWYCLFLNPEAFIYLLNRYLINNKPIEMRALLVIKFTSWNMFICKHT